MNTPSAGEGNWSWRFSPDALRPAVAKQLATLMEVSDRDAYEVAIEGEDVGKPSDHASLRAELGATV